MVSQQALRSDANLLKLERHKSEVATAKNLPTAEILKFNEGFGHRHHFLKKTIFTQEIGEKRQLGIKEII